MSTIAGCTSAGADSTTSTPTTPSITATLPEDEPVRKTVAPTTTVSPSVTTTVALAPQPVADGVILVRDGKVLRLVDAAGNVIRERSYDDRIDVVAVVEGGCLLVQVGRQAWHLTTTDLRVDSTLGPFESPPWYWSAFEATKHTVAVESDRHLLVVDPATCATRSFPTLPWPEGYISSNGTWLVPERNLSGASVVRLDPTTGTAGPAEFGWATAEMAEAVLGFELPAFRDAVRVSPPAELSDGSICLLVESSDGVDVVVLERDGSERLRVKVGRWSSLAFLDTDANVVVVRSHGDSPQHDVIDLESGERLGGSYGEPGIASRWVVGDLLITSNRDSEVLDLSAGAEIQAPAGRIRATSPDGRWLVVQDNGVVVVAVSDPGAGKQIADGIPVAWFEEGEVEADTAVEEA